MNVVDPGKPVWILADFGDRQVNCHGEVSRSRRTSLSIPLGRILKLSRCLRVKINSHPARRFWKTTARELWTSFLSPHHGLDTDEVVEFMEPILAAKNGYFPRLALGLAHYRSGNFKEAAETVVLNEQGAEWIRPISSFVHAMGCAKSGDKELAKKSFDKAVARANEIAPTPTSGVDLRAPWCLYQGLKREAAEVMGIEVEPVPQPASSDE